MEARINSLSGNLVLGVVPIFIGTAPDNQLVLSDSEAGAHHAEIRPAGQEYTLIDLGTNAGTLLNGYRLSPQVPHILHDRDTITIGSTQLTYEVKSSSSVPPTLYVAPGSAGVPPTVYAPSGSFNVAPTVVGSADLAGSSSFPVSQVVPPPPPANNYSIDPYGSSALKKKNHRGLWIALSIGVVFLIVIITFFSLANHGPDTTSTTPTLTLIHYCNALSQGDFPTAYKQFSSAYQSQQSESQFVASFPDGKPDTCTVGTVDDAAGSGVVAMTIKGSTFSYKETLLNENGAWKIASEEQQK